MLSINFWQNMKSATFWAIFNKQIRSPWLGTLSNGAESRVARWFVFKPKIQILVNFGGSWIGRWWYILWTLGSYYGLWDIL
jgi:hypothetical protein